MDTLNIGCGNRPLPGAVNHDRAKHSPHVDIHWGLERPWPTLYLDELTGLYEAVYDRGGEDDRHQTRQHGDSHAHSPIV